jgi:hypothetical protein
VAGMAVFHGKLLVTTKILNSNLSNNNISNATISFSIPETIRVKPIEARKHRIVLEIIVTSKTKHLR